MSAEILVVDDEDALVGVLTRSLAAHGYAVRTAATGRDALFALTERAPDAILLDINLPDITGWEVLRQMTAQDHARMPVIVFSASPLSPARLQEFQLTGTLSKPFPLEALLRLLEQATRQSQGAWESVA